MNPVIDTEPTSETRSDSSRREAPRRRARVVHVITKLELGGAQKVTLMTLERLPRELYDLELVSGSEGLLRERAEAIPDLRCSWISALVREVRPLRDLRALVDLWRLFKHRRPDIVHTHSSKAGILGRWSAWLAGVPIIFHTAHGFGFNDYQGSATRAFYIWTEKLTRRITTRSVVVSLANARRGEKLGILEPQGWILCRDAIPVDEFLPGRPEGRGPETWGIPSGRRIVGMVACFKPQKSPVDFIDMAARVLESRRDVHFVIAGDGELRGQVEARIAHHGIGGHVTLLGWQSDMPGIYGNLDVFVLTSLWEGQPCVYSEAMASGLPVVATDVDGAREAILPGETGFLHPRRDVAGMAASVLQLLASPDLRRKMGAAARSRVGEFDIGLSVATLESAYRECLNGRAR